jgi:hypothetical protein
LEAQSLVASDPGIALQHRTIATLFRHYIDFLAPWYDLNDSQNLFGTLLPQRAMQNSILFKAVIAFSACHESRTRPCDRYQELGHVFHGACVRDLLKVLDDVHPNSDMQEEVQGDYLSATCLLRSYEILNGKANSVLLRSKWLIKSGDTRQQQHLLGAYSFASSSHIDTKVRGIAQSGAWNYLREEITMALELRRAVRLGSKFDYAAIDDWPDDIWAHSITYILARVVNFCFDATNEMSFAERKETWEYLSECVSDWCSNRPKSFNPFSGAPKPGNAFPSIWLLRPWHGKFFL